MATLTHKTCAKCKQVLPVEKFYKEPRNRSGLTSYCIACNKARAKSRRRKQEPAIARGPEPVAWFRIHDVWPIYRPNQG
ncbi:hypothetical protein ACWJKU_01390 [Methylocaldum sp. MU1018]